jgi:hypothetical protein
MVRFLFKQVSLTRFEQVRWQSAMISRVCYVRAVAFLFTIVELRLSLSLSLSLSASPFIN